MLIMTIYNDLVSATMFCAEHNHLVEHVALENGIFQGIRPALKAEFDTKDYGVGIIDTANRRISRYASDDALLDYPAYHIAGAINSCRFTDAEREKLFTEYMLSSFSYKKISRIRTNGYFWCSQDRIIYRMTRKQVNEFIDKMQVGFSSLLSQVNNWLYASDTCADHRIWAEVKLEHDGGQWAYDEIASVYLNLHFLDDEGDKISDDISENIRLYDYYTPMEAAQSILTMFYDAVYAHCNADEKAVLQLSGGFEMQKTIYEIADQAGVYNNSMCNLNAWLFALPGATNSLPNCGVPRVCKAKEFGAALKMILDVPNADTEKHRTTADNVMDFYKSHSDEEFIAEALNDNPDFGSQCACGTLWYENYATREQKAALTYHSGKYSAYADALKFMHGVEVCENCGEVIAIADSQDVIDGIAYDNSYGTRIKLRHWCKDCVEEETFKSDHSDDYYTSNVDTVEVRGLDGIEMWTRVEANDDAKQCNECGEYCTADYANQQGFIHQNTSGYEICVCDECWEEEDYIECNDCGCVASSSDDSMAYSEEDDCWYCDSCYEEHQPQGLEEYGYTRGEYFRNSTKVDEPEPELYLGIELETECDSSDYANSMARDIKSVIGEQYVACKYDGSLNDGCEIVSQPFTPWYHLNEGRTDYWGKIFEQCSNWSATSFEGGRCGLHIHISRSYIDNDDAVFRLDRMIQKHKDEFLRFSQRGSNTDYCEIDTDYSFNIKADDSVDEKVHKYKYNACRKGKYCAVNIEHSQTVEVRLWRGTLNEDRFYATIEMTAGMALVAHDSTNEFIENGSWSELKEAILKALNDYNIEHEELTKYLENRDL